MLGTVLRMETGVRKQSEIQQGNQLVRPRQAGKRTKTYISGKSCNPRLGPWRKRQCTLYGEPQPNQQTLCRPKGAHSRKLVVYLVHWRDPNLHPDCASELCLEKRKACFLGNVGRSREVLAAMLRNKHCLFLWFSSKE